MSYPVHFETQSAQRLELLGRHRQPGDQLLYLRAGSLLMRLGRDEFVLRQGDLFWLPADCLHGLTLWQGCHLIRIRFSVRVQGARPRAAGFLHPHPLVLPLLERLEHLLLSAPLEWQGHSGRLCRLLADLLPEFKISSHAAEPMSKGVQCALSTLRQGGELPTIAHACQQEQGLSPREVLDQFQQQLGISLIEWLEQWQLYQTLQHLKQGMSEEQAYRQAGFSTAEQYQQAQQRYRP
jgi:AraC-like DNA-binding protein